MEKLITSNYGEETAIFRKSAESPDIQQGSLGHQGRKIFTSILLVLIVLSELLISSGDIEIGLLLYAGTVVALSLIPILIKEQEIRNTCQAFLLIPILRFMNFSVPMFSEMLLVSFVFIYAPMIVPLTIVTTHQGSIRERLGLNFKNLWFYFPVSIFLGLILGQAEVFLVQTTPLIPDLSLVNILMLTIVMIFFVGFTEELLFRLILQTNLEGVFGLRTGLVFSSLIFGLMNLSYGGFYGAFYTFFVGFLLGYIFQRTKSLTFITLIHGFINVFSFGILPHAGNIFNFI